MKEQRSLGQALQLTPQQQAFVKSSGTEDEKTNPIEKRPAFSQTNSNMASTSQPSPSVNRPLVLVPLTTRLHPQTAEALRNAYLQQKLARQSPSTQQEIVEEAICKWLGNHGFIA